MKKSLLLVTFLASALTARAYADPQELFTHGPGGHYPGGDHGGDHDHGPIIIPIPMPGPGPGHDDGHDHGGSSGDDSYHYPRNGDRVLDQYDRVATVLNVYSNGRAEISLDNVNSTAIVDTNTLAVEVQCNDGVCAGDHVLDNNNRLGNVVDVFSNGKSNVNLANYDTNFIAVNYVLGVGYRCIENLCAGDHVIDRYNRAGFVKDVFDNGAASVDLDNGYNDVIMSFDDLNIRLNCRLKVNCDAHN